MTTYLFTHSDGLKHRTPAGHPEQVARLEYINDALSVLEFDALVRRSAPVCEDADILLCHPHAHLQKVIDAEPYEGAVALDGDTFMSAGSTQAARRAVGGCIAAVDAVLVGEATNAFVGCRPPGHHAEQTLPMGFCLFGNAAIAACHAMERHGLERVAVIDFDVHHGNGTQALLWDEPRALFFSSHQNPLWPGTGMAEDTGEHHNIHNLPLPPHSDGHLMRATYEARVWPVIDHFKPQLIIVSAGFDAHVDDPLAQLNWATDDFAWITQKICDLAAEHCKGRVVSTLEGGYDLSALAASVAVHVSVLMENGA